METATGDAPVDEHEQVTQHPTTSTADNSEPATDNGRSKRVRKTKIRLEEEDNYLNDALGLNKKKRPKREGHEVSQLHNANALASLKRYKPKKIDENKRLSANMIAIKAFEELSDRSLKTYLPVLRYFLTPRVISRLESVGDGNVKEEILEGGKKEIPLTSAVDTTTTDTTETSETTAAVTVHHDSSTCTTTTVATHGDSTTGTDSNDADVSSASKMEVDSEMVNEGVGETVVKSDEIVYDVIVKQPVSLKNVTMRPYQLQGLQWLIGHYQRGINCILADGKRTEFRHIYSLTTKYF